MELENENKIVFIFGLDLEPDTMIVLKIEEKR